MATELRLSTLGPSGRCASTPHLCLLLPCTLLYHPFTCFNASRIALEVRRSLAEMEKCLLLVLVALFLASSTLVNCCGRRRSACASTRRAPRMRVHRCVSTAVISSHTKTCIAWTEDGACRLGCCGQSGKRVCNCLVAPVGEAT
jgi:hypothetical protein